jgi:MATE family multidrug resistance protein
MSQLAPTGGVTVGDWRHEVRRLAALSIPAALTQLGWMMLGMVDIVMVGHLGVFELDAAALGNIWTFGTLIIGMGIIFGIDPIVAQAHGADDHERVGLTLHRGLVLAAALAVPITISWLFTGTVLVWMGQEPELAAGAHSYVLVQLPSVMPFLAFTVLRQYLQGRGIVAPALWATVAANVFNVAANWALIFGHLGLPAMGLQGAGIATGSTRIILLIGLAIWVWRFRLHEGGWTRPDRRMLQWDGLREILSHGVPVGVQYGLEGWAFQIATLLAGRLGEAELAAHVIVLNLASLAFMLPLGVSMGAATRVGNLIGAGYRPQAQRSAMIALGIGAATMTGSAVLFLFGRAWLPRLFTPDATTVALATAILPIAAAFALFDGTQVVGGGILRGMGRTRPAAIFNMVAFYVLGLPAAATLAFGFGWDLRGLWWGLCLGLMCVAAALVVYIRRHGPAPGGRDPFARIPQSRE